MPAHSDLLSQFWFNFTHNLFKPLLLFFYMGFLIPILKVPFEFPKALYQGLTIFLLVAIGWHGGEELANLGGKEFKEALGFMLIGFFLNFVIGILAYQYLRTMTRLRRIDAATVAGYYGSDSAGTFVTCVGVLNASLLKFAAYMPVMLAVMEIPGCLVALYLISRLRRRGMDALGNMPNEPGYDAAAVRAVVGDEHAPHHDSGHGDAPAHGTTDPDLATLLREVFLNPGLYLLFGGITIGFVSGLQGEKITKEPDSLFLNLFQGLLCLFLLEMGMTACRRLRDLKSGGAPFIFFAIAAPNFFAALGMTIAHLYSLSLGVPFQLGTYVLFAVLCAAASYIAVPAVQRMAIPEASPTLPLAASLGLTFSYNVTVGIPVYILIATALNQAWPVAGGVLAPGG